MAASSVPVDIALRRASGSELSITEVYTREEERENKPLDVIGHGFCHHRDPPVEFQRALGREKREAKKRGAGERESREPHAAEQGVETDPRVEAAPGGAEAGAEPDTEMGRWESSP